ncbi:MAG: molybdate ABC transporter substrate-binding protein [Acidobacteriota bacterium]
MRTRRSGRRSGPVPGAAEATQRTGLAPVVALILLLCGCGGGVAADREELTIFAAASLRDVVEDSVHGFGESGAAEGAEVTLNFAGSNVLAQQIFAAPAADLFLSADEDWVRFLEAKGRVVPGTVRPILGNLLVVIARPDSPLASVPWTGLESLASEDVGQLVLADPGAVPAGRYAKAHLERAAAPVWAAVQDRLVPALDVRAALQLVASDPRHVGIVYRTDARASDDVVVLAELPELEDQPIVYWVAVIQGGGGDAAAKRFLSYFDADGAAIAERHGFLAAP